MPRVDESRLMRDATSQKAQSLPLAGSHPILDRSESVRQAAERLGFECLEQEWKGWQETYRFRCRNGHLSLKRPRALISTVSCSHCRRDDSWRRLLASARKIGTRCLEQRWLGTHSYHRFCCPRGHQWKRIGGYALRDASCPTCARRIAGQRRQHPDGLGRLQAVASKHGGECLSPVYDGLDRRYSFRCVNGHTWETTAYKLLQGSWCPTCKRTEISSRKMRADGLELLQAIVRGHGGALLDSAYHGLEAKYRVCCRSGHAWETTGNLLRTGAWCRRCYFERKQQEALVAARELAEARGGKCLTLEYPGSRAKWHWLCHRGHSWHAYLSSVKQGHWCRECANMSRITKPDSSARMRYRSAPRHGVER